MTQKHDVKRMAPPRIPKVFFDRRDHLLLTMVNEMLESDKLQIHSQRRFFHFLHPRGIKEMAESKGLRIAYAVIHLLESLESGQIENRINALRALRDEVMCSTSTELQMNTARVLIEIMKDLVRAKGDYQRQLGLAHDFRVVASGKPRVVRSYLRKYDLLEMPEEWNQLVFDDHVHDANTKGRKSATHLIMDAWIKGIRRLRVIYYNYITPETAGELMEAAAVMGIMVRIGIEFFASFYDQYAQIIWVPRGFADARDFLRFLDKPSVRALMKEGRKVSDFQRDHVLAILAQFNQRHRHVLNQTFEIDMPPLDPTAFMSFVGIGQASLLHLAKFIHAGLLPLMKEKLADLQHQYEKADEKERLDIEERVNQMNRLDSDAIHDLFLKAKNNPSVPDINNPQESNDRPSLMTLSPCELIDQLTQLNSGYRITLNLSNMRGKDVLELLYDCRGRITRLEIFNLKDYAEGKIGHLPVIDKLQQAINSGNVIQLKRLIIEMIQKLKEDESPYARSRIEKFRKILENIETFKNLYRIKTLKSRIGSDSTGHSPRLHEMGLAVMESLPRRARKEAVRQSDNARMVLPFHVDTYLRLNYPPMPEDNRAMNRLLRRIRMIPGLSGIGLKPAREWVALEDFTRMVPRGNIVTVSGKQKGTTNQLALLPETPRLQEDRRSFNNLNTTVKNTLKVIVGFIPAFLTFVITHDWWVLAWFGAFIWFGITGLRNILQSVIGGGGFRRSPLLQWNDYVSWERLTDSLLYTGFSVPLLDYLVKTLLLNHGFGINTTTHPVMLYAIMATVNGIYLTTHNLFRGLPREAAFGNFFRSLFSIPVAFAFNEMAGGILILWGASSIEGILQSWAAVISKAASDCVAGFIEGSVDRAKNIQNRLSDYRQKMAQFMDTYARLEILYPDADVLYLLDKPRQWLLDAGEESRELINILIINALDLLYFWMYQPRSRTAFKNFICTMSADERSALIKSQQILTMEREISQMFIDGIVGRHFSKPLAFYLDRSGEYLRAINTFCPEDDHGSAESPSCPGIN